MGPQEIKIKLPFTGINVSAKIWGPENGAPIIALHGWLDNADSFQGLAPWLNNYRLISIDLPGHGLSDHIPPGMLYHFADYIRYVDEITQALNLKNFGLIGHSMGAGIASLYASAYSNKINFLGLIEGIGPMTTNEEDAAQLLHDSIEDLKKFGHRPATLYKTVDEAARIRMIAGNITSNSAQLLVKRNLKPHNNGYVWKTDPRLRLKSPYRFTELQVKSMLSKIKCPTLLIKAEKSIFKNTDILESRMLMIKRSTTQTLAGGHHLHLDDPNPTGRQLSIFSNSHTGKQIS